jgi:hypothetical protein
MRRVSTNFILDQDLLDWIRAEAARRHCSMSQVVRDLVVDRRERDQT